MAAVAHEAEYALFDEDPEIKAGFSRGLIEGTTAFAFRADGDVVAAVDTAVRQASPVIGLWTGSSPVECVGRVFAAMTRASGWVPQISVLLEQPEGTAAYGPALSDVVIGWDKSADIVVTSGSEATFRARQLVSLLGSQETFQPLNGTGPPEPPRSLDDVLDSPLLPLRAHAARNVLVGLSRLSTRTVGVVAEQAPLDAAAADKAARFVRMCDAFGIPLVVVAGARTREHEVPGGAKLVHAFAESVVPRVTLVTGRSHVTMNSRGLGATKVFAWPTARGADDVDEVIDPGETRQKLVETFRDAPVRRGNHGNIPL